MATAVITMAPASRTPTERVPFLSPSSWCIMREAGFTGNSMSSRARCWRVIDAGSLGGGLGGGGLGAGGEGGGGEGGGGEGGGGEGGGGEGGGGSEGGGGGDGEGGPGGGVCCFCSPSQQQKETAHDRQMGADHSVDWPAVDAETLHPAFKAVLQSDTEKLQTLCEQPGFDVNAIGPVVNGKAMPAICMAVSRRDTESVRILLKHGPDVDVNDHGDSRR